jgi:hypothetical protein
LDRTPPEEDPDFRRYVDLLVEYEEFLRFAPNPAVEPLQRAAALTLFRMANVIPPDSEGDYRESRNAELAIHELLNACGATPLYGDERLLAHSAMLTWLLRNYVSVLVTSTSSTPIATPGASGYVVAYRELHERTRELPRIRHPVHLDVLLAFAEKVSIVASVEPVTRKLKYSVVVETVGKAPSIECE